MRMSPALHRASASCAIRVTRFLLTTPYRHIDIGPD
jgi:hypothetical protein